MIADFMEKGRNPTVGTLAHLGQVDLRIAAKGTDAAEAEALIAPVEEEIRRRLGDLIFGADSDTLESQISARLNAMGARVGLAELGSGGVVGERLVVESREALYVAAASQFFLQAIAAVDTHGRFTVALSGGSTPRGMYELLATDPTWRAQLPWERIHFFWGDERYVPPDHADSNFRMANEVLLSVAPVPAENIHRIYGETASPADAASQYEHELRQVFEITQGQLPRFDLVLLGLGSEGHTASLFPGTRALAENQRLVVSNWVGKLFADRITLTPPVLNNAACVLFIVSGEDKATALKAIVEGPYEPDQLPAQLINPTDGRLLWLLDQAAAHELDSNFP